MLHYLRMLLCGLIILLIHNLPCCAGLAFEHEKRQSDCANPCGYGAWLCCDYDQICLTDDADQAQCSSTARTTITAVVLTTLPSGPTTTVVVTTTAAAPQPGSYASGDDVPLTQTLVQTTNGVPTTTTVVVVGQVLDNGSTGLVGPSDGQAYYILSSSAPDAQQTTLADGVAYYISEGFSPNGSLETVLPTQSLSTTASSESPSATTPPASSGNANQSIWASWKLWKKIVVIVVPAVGAVIIGILLYFSCRRNGWLRTRKTLTQDNRSVAESNSSFYNIQSKTTSPSERGARKRAAVEQYQGPPPNYSWDQSPYNTVVSNNRLSQPRSQGLRGYGP